ncbi:hypothetical protein DFH07DRAFT_781552 [Mycena maculata]|uniref:Uncharacterized protein n=1 Tax=Mycena maculata TaxID=230809 RepID=A0AAD7HXN4_9AGAR|nr:hypothetical protein DFH07DRAFT_781552 [Mycena maculata]
MIYHALKEERGVAVYRDQMGSFLLPSSPMHRPSTHRQIRLVHPLPMFLRLKLAPVPNFGPSFALLPFSTSRRLSSGCNRHGLTRSGVRVYLVISDSLATFRARTFPSNDRTCTSAKANPDTLHSASRPRQQRHSPLILCLPLPAALRHLDVFSLPSFRSSWASAATPSLATRPKACQPFYPYTHAFTGETSSPRVTGVESTFAAMEAVLPSLFKSQKIHPPPLSMTARSEGLPLFWAELMDLVLHGSPNYF